MRIRVALIGALLLIGLAPAIPAEAAAGWVPGQFIAKQYTEALGRMPTQAEWSSAVQEFTVDGCGIVSLTDLGSSIFRSPEFIGLGYDASARILVLYRAALNRDPDPSGFDSWRHAMAAGTSWSTVVSDFYSSPEFADLTGRICSGAHDSSATSYSFGAQPPFALSASTTTEADLQQRLDTAAPGTTVALPPRTLLKLTAPLRVPDGVTLTTAGAPDNRHYADMARLVRAADFNNILVYANGTLSHVWIDGGRRSPETADPLRSDVRLIGGSAPALTHSRVTDSPGPQSVQVLGTADGHPCPQATVSDNLVTAYSSDHYRKNSWTDGIATTCEHTTIDRNEIVDATDVAIVLYRSAPETGPQTIQKSTAEDNRILSAGNSAYGGLVHDPLFIKAGQHVRTMDFTGAAISRNTLWTSPNTHFDIGLGAGTREWFGANSHTGKGAAITGNTTGRLTARVQTGIAVDGMIDADISGNTARWAHAAIGHCPDVDFAAAISTGYASGAFSPTPQDRAFDRCIGH
ncbi:MAG TPA: DUF4214 domain-containing protein [Mycobacteriales bacterium]|nr:DUF4214 domain-containing protein [Mycobacteriales bacterium]